MNSGHMKELESLLIRIVSPDGNRTGGRFATSKSLYPVLSRRMKELDADRQAEILGGAYAERRRKARATHLTGADALHGVGKRQLCGWYKGEVFTARLRQDGQIRFGGRLYVSPSAAGAAILKRSCNGWAFWHYRDGGQWVPLSALRA
jgi:hypothetical protein